MLHHLVGDANNTKLWLVQLSSSSLMLLESLMHRIPNYHPNLVKSVCALFPIPYMVICTARAVCALLIVTTMIQKGWFLNVYPKTSANTPPDSIFALIFVLTVTTIASCSPALAKQ
ncbi:hypothetical protein A0J61_04970 [Choanephora cucurbitarum]|uniref:Uncharacterized protein n=1 Tax=Choanephora cucurbitarum TaxID=101091 RepID=A0A1C7NCX6_9FUNG|nr:hypothetical protein A0J61_04970 [Choanephora cucurbitarum]